MLSKSILILCFPTVNPIFTNDIEKNSFRIPYEEFCDMDQTPNKNTIEYNTMTAEELIRTQNEKILDDLFNEEIFFKSHK